MMLYFRTKEQFNKLTAMRYGLSKLFLTASPKFGVSLISAESALREAGKIPWQLKETMKRNDLGQKTFRTHYFLTLDRLLYNSFINFPSKRGNLPLISPEKILVYIA